MAESGCDDFERDFNACDLGTKEYWDSAYEREVGNFNDTGDVGEIWFGEETMEKILDWLDDEEEINKEDSVIDLGSGNGMMCIELRKRGFQHVSGVDYSELAVMLSQSVARNEGLQDIEFVCGDLLSDERPNPCTCLVRTYKIVLDKGTYDAISLMPGDSLADRQKYLHTVKSIMRPDSLFSLTSCNWTKEQLMNFFGNDFGLVSQIPFKTFSFGGKTGSTYTSLVFKLQPS